MLRWFLSFSWLPWVITLSYGLFLVGCASLPSNENKIPSYVLADTQDTNLAKAAASYQLANPNLSGVYLLSEGMEAFVARVGLIKAAEVSLDLQYYIWKDDLTGRLLVGELLHAADRGVRVRLLLDDLDTTGKDTGLHLLERHPNIEVRLFNAFANRNAKSLDFITDLGRVNNRMHNKSLTADNTFTVLGGRNIGNEYFGAQSHAEFNDLDILGTGKIVSDVSAMFDKYWNSQLTWQSEPFFTQDIITPEQEKQARILFGQQNQRDVNNPYVDAVAQSTILNKSDDVLNKLVWANAELLADAPDKTLAHDINAQTHITPALLTLLNSANAEVLIISPYFVPNDAFFNFLGELVKSCFFTKKVHLLVSVF